jgi:hypothetical protein
VLGSELLSLVNKALLDNRSWRFHEGFSRAGNGKLGIEIIELPKIEYSINFNKNIVNGTK